MNAYEKWIDIIRSEGGHDNPNILQLGTVMEDGKIRLDNLTLEKGDYLLDCNLRLDDKEKAYYHTQNTSSGVYLTDSQHNSYLEEYKRNVLQKGNLVVAIKLENVEKYVVLAKVVDTA